MDDRKISFIVPIYNAEPYLERCLRSIVNQSYTDIEIILVNDGSEDSCDAICRSWQERDRRIQYFYQENTGVSSARNLGMDMAKGYYISFVDADDYLELDFCKELLLVAQKEQSDIICCSERKYLPDGRLLSSGKNDHAVISFSGDQFEYGEEKEKRVVWGALFKRELIQNIRFQTNLFVGEDALFFAKAVCFSKRITYINWILYNYSVLDNSVSRGCFSDRKSTEIDAWEQICKEFVNFPNIRFSAEATLGETCLDMMEKYAADPLFTKSYRKMIIATYRKHFWQVLKYDRMKKSSMRGHIALFILPNLYVKYRFWKKRITR